MKKQFLWLLMFSFMAFACNSSSKEKDKEVQQAPNDVPLSVSANSETLNNAFGDLLTHYQQLHDALVNWDNESAKNAAKQVESDIQQFPYVEIKADEAIVSTAKSLMANMEEAANKLTSSINIEQQRRAFSTLSDNLYNVARTIQYDKDPLYKVTCPMAFNDDESASWVSKENKVVNPYLGTKHPKYKAGMLECGEVTDSIHYTKQ